MGPADTDPAADLGFADHPSAITQSYDALESFDELVSPSASSVRATDAPAITERPNSLTSNLDVANAEGIVRLMRQVDAQTVNGYHDFISIADRQMLSAMVDAVDRMLELLDRPGRARVILSGAGTSGRLAMATARMINHVLKKLGRAPLAAYTIPGGDGALVVAQENAEDSMELGVRDIDDALQGAVNVVYFGVTCGLSAPYVMAQAEHLRDRDNTLIVLLGFNPPDMARDTPIEGRDVTCRELVRRIADDPRHVLLCPIVGPEAITGSTRLKGGTATMMLVQMLTFCALGRGGYLPAEEAELLHFGRGRTLDSLRVMLRHYEDARTVTYLQSDHIAALIHRAGLALRSGRGVYYLARGSFGLYAMFDAAECPPTFGAAHGEIRGFVEGGWEMMLGAGRKSPRPTVPEYEDLYRIGWDDFEREVLPTLEAGDLVVGIEEDHIGPELQRLLRGCSERGATTGVIVPNHQRGHERVEVDVYMPVQPLRTGIISRDRSYSEMAVKLALNCISTGGYVLAGKVFGNRMIDLRLTNSKLYERAQRLVAELMGVSQQAAKAALLSAIYQSDGIGHREMDAPVRQHCAAAAHQAKVVPTAMLLATGNFSYAEAREALDSDPIVRNLIGRHVGGAR
jgi:N-acetylmuramic acid 6-phosphate (MurNAc-6-P) etherase